MDKRKKKLEYGIKISNKEIVIVPQNLHEHSDRTQFHDQYHVDNQDHPSTKEFEQEYQENALKEIERNKKKQPSSFM